MAPYNPLHNFKVLLADADQQLAYVLKTMLGDMGFSNVQYTQSGQQALALLSQATFDFCITDWNLKELNGIDLITRIRRDPGSPNPTLPIIMLSGQSEPTDVMQARDSGINEYVVKPFSAKTVYNRLERIVEFPRYFIASTNFVGPDRRNKTAPPPGTQERRVAKIVAERKPWDAARELSSSASPKLWMPDYGLKHKLGKDISLNSIITPGVLNQAQASIEALSEDSLQWIKKDLADLKALLALLKDEKRPQALLNELTELSLIISSRSGTFGYHGASKVAYALYLFCRKNFKPDKPSHQIVLQKHVDVIELIFGAQLRGNSEQTQTILQELQAMTKKYA